MKAVAIAAETDPHHVLETGDILLAPQTQIGLSAEDFELLRNVGLSGGHHKNIAYKPHKDKLSGLDKTSAPMREQARAVLRRFSAWATEFTARVLPKYQGRWIVDYASLRPLEEAGRSLPFKKRNDLLHVDAFPTRPTNGGLILRIFHNFHLSKPRVWFTSDPFETLAARYAQNAGLSRIAHRGRLLKEMLRRAHLPVRSPYDEFMLTFHDYLKGNGEFQSNCPKYKFEFAPGQTWMAFTDIVPHAVESGQFALEQTLIVPRNALAAPECAPIAILEKLAGCRLA